MREYRFHWQTWVGIGLLLLLLLFTMFLPDGQVQTQSGGSVLRISIAKWALTVGENDIDTSKMQLMEGKKIDNNRVVPVLRMWGWMILLPIVLIMVSMLFMIARRRTFSGLLIAIGLVTLICELVIRTRTPSNLFWKEKFDSPASAAVLISAVILSIYGILCMGLLRSHNDTVVQWTGVQDIDAGSLANQMEQKQLIPSRTVQRVGMLQGIRGEYAGQSLEIHAGEEIVLGRDPKYCMLIFQNPRVSRRQCGIRYDVVNGCYQAIDYSSTGTTLSNGTLLTTSGYTSIPPGTVLYMAGGQEAIQLM